MNRVGFVQVCDNLALRRMLPDRAAQLTAIINFRKPVDDRNSEKPSSPNTEQTQPDKHDLEYLEEARSLFEAGEFPRALNVADKIADAEANRRLHVLINFHEALNLIDSNLEQAEDLTNKLQPGQEKAVLYLTIANKRLEKHQLNEAEEVFMRAMTEIRALPKAQQGVLLLTAAYQLSALDITVAKEVFAEGLRVFENVDLEILMSSAWTRTIEIDEVPRRFPLTVNRIERKTGNLVKPFIVADQEWTIATILGMNKEKVLGPLLISVAQMLLHPEAK